MELDNLPNGFDQLDEPSQTAIETGHYLEVFDLANKRRAPLSHELEEWLIGQVNADRASQRPIAVEWHGRSYRFKLSRR